MRATIWMCGLVLAIGLTGCGSPNSTPSQNTAPLTVADWQKLPPDQKYTPETLERLKTGDPALETAEGWEKFSRTTLAENRKKDGPKGRK